MSRQNKPSAPDLKQSISDYLHNGWRVLPLHNPTKDGGCSCGKTECEERHSVGKHPRLADWSKNHTGSWKVASKWLRSWPSMNIGVAMGGASGIIDIETDTKHDGEASLADLETLYGPLPRTLSFRSGSGGIHRLFRAPNFKVKTVGQLGHEVLEKKKTGVDVRGDGGQAVMPPSLHASGKRYEWLDECAAAKLPKAWLDLLRGGGAVDSKEVLDDAEKMMAKANRQLDDITIEKAEEYLEHVDPNCTRLEWVTVGQALHVQFDGSDDALDLYKAWSAGELGNNPEPDNYEGEEDCETNWETFGKEEEDETRVATFRSVIEMAKAGGWVGTSSPATLPTSERKRLRKADEAACERLENDIEAAESMSALQDVIAEIKETELFDTSKDALSGALREKWLELKGKKLTKTSADALLHDGVEAEERAKESIEEKGWSEPYIFVAEDKGSFFNTHNTAVYESRTFDQMYASELVTPVMRAQGKLIPPYSPSVLLLNADMIPKVYGVRYRPGEEAVFERDGQSYANTYRAWQGDEVAEKDWTDEDRAAVEAWREHIVWLLEPEAAALITQFLAYFVQHTGERVRWCPVICGPEGVGKSILGNLARAVLGRSNVNIVGPAALSEIKYNKWQDGAQLACVEEIKVDGASKWEVMRSLKEAITNEYISIHAKGQNPYTTENNTSYLAFTNHRNALALTPGDRRYYVTMTRFRDAADFIADLGGRELAEAHFAFLCGLLGPHAGALRGWLRSVDLATFPLGRAPDSEEKHEMVAMSRSDIDMAILAIIDGAESVKVSKSLIELEALKELLGMRADIGVVTGQALGRSLRELGWDILSAETIDPMKDGTRSRWFFKRAMWRQDPRANPYKAIRARVQAVRDKEKKG